MELEHITPQEPDEAWQQQLLTPTILRATSTARPVAAPRATATKTSPHLRQLGLVGIAQAREALAEASRRAEQRAEHKAA